MKIETKSFLLGISAGIIGVLTFILIIGDVETEFSFSTGDKKQDKKKKLLCFVFWKKGIWEDHKIMNSKTNRKELEGTITGEHGVGLHKKEYLKKEHADNLPTMKLIKRTMDPNNIMNPGKIFDLN